jgi:hypothetical protein
MAEYLYMNPVLIKEINELKKNTNCPNKYNCLKNISKHSRKEKMRAHAGLSECINKNSTHCEYALKSHSITICSCPLRKKLSIEIDKIS